MKLQWERDEWEMKFDVFIFGDPLTGTRMEKRDEIRDDGKMEMKRTSRIWKS